MLVAVVLAPLQGGAMVSAPGMKVMAEHFMLEWIWRTYNRELAAPVFKLSEFDLPKAMAEYCK